MEDVLNVEIFSYAWLETEMATFIFAVFVYACVCVWGGGGV